VTRHMAKPLLLPLFSSLLLASGPALSQPNLPDKASATAHQKVLENAHPAVMAEVERMKAEQKARSDQSLSSFPSASQGNSGISVFVPPSTPVIVAVETEDGELVATEF
jgi:hypothetical protein